MILVHTVSYRYFNYHKNKVGHAFVSDLRFVCCGMVVVFCESQSVQQAIQFGKYSFVIKRWGCAGRDRLIQREVGSDSVLTLADKNRGGHEYCPSFL
jgi:hypothetical protein